MEADWVYLGSVAADGSERKCRIAEADRGRRIIIIHFGKEILSASRFNSQHIKQQREKMSFENHPGWSAAGFLFRFSFKAKQFNVFFFPIIGCLSRNSKMSISNLNLLSIFTFSTPLPSSPPPRLICLSLSAQIDPTFIPVPPLNRKHSVCLCFADRDVWFF